MGGKGGREGQVYRDDDGTSSLCSLHAFIHYSSPAPSFLPCLLPFLPPSLPQVLISFPVMAGTFAAYDSLTYPYKGTIYRLWETASCKTYINTKNLVRKGGRKGGREGKREGGI